MDVNDNGPHFDMTEIQSSPDGSHETCFCPIYFNEQASLGSIVLRLSAYDLDLNDTLHFGLIHSARPSSSTESPMFIPSSVFELNPVDGLLKWKPQVNSIGKPILMSVKTREPVDLLDKLEFQVTIYFLNELSSFLVNLI